MFRAGISEETLLSIPCIKGLSPEILLFKRKRDSVPRVLLA
jgi:hypothetical protein